MTERPGLLSSVILFLMLQNVTGLWEKVDTDVYRWVRQLSTCLQAIEEEVARRRCY
jgi:hypothetical protein